MAGAQVNSTCVVLQCRVYPSALFAFGEDQFARAKLFPYGLSLRMLLLPSLGDLCKVGIAGEEDDKAIWDAAA